MPVHRATNQARMDNQNGIFLHQVNPKKQETNDDIIAHGKDLEPRAADSLISPYKDVRYMLFVKT